MANAAKRKKKFNWFKNKQNELLILLFFLAVFIGIRSIHFADYLNFSGDQGLFATEVLKIYETKKPTLIGPPISMYFKGRQIFQGPATYYEMLAFLVLGNFDPIVSSYLFMLFCALMIIPLYFGTKMLINKKAAILIIAIYTLLPYYVDFTRFLWNPTFQLSLLPLLIFFMGWFKQSKNNWVFLGMSFLLGVLLQFHYQFAIVILGLLVYYTVISRINFLQILIFLAGVAAGFSPIIIFEIRNQFYNTQTIKLFLENWSAVKKPSGGRQHYFLSLSFITLLMVLGMARKWIEQVDEKTFQRLFLGFATVLLLVAIIYYSPKPQHSFWAIDKGWNYPSELKAYQIIRKENLQNYNVITIIGYDNLASVIKYLHKKDGVKMNYDEYWHIQNLFVVARKDLKYHYMDDPAFGIQIFRPYRKVKQWELNPYFNMYLVEKTQ